jgi:hypothetical protein
MTVGRGPDRAPRVALPLGVWRRQAWRPPALDGLEHLTASLAARTEPFLERSSRLLAWQQRLSGRLSPWSGWPPLALPLDGQPEPSPYGAEPEPPRERPRVSSERPLAGEARRSEPGTPRREGPSAPAARPVVARAGRARPAPRPAPFGAGPGPRLALLRAPIGLAAARTGRLLDGPFAPSPPAAGGEGGRPAGGPWPLAPLDRLALRAPGVRQEIRGGFPHQERARAASAAVRAEPPVLPASGALRGATVAVEPTPPPVEPTGLASPATAALTSRPASPPLDSALAIERLIERTVLPAPLPGLELRLVPPDDQPPGEPGSEAPAARPEQRAQTAKPTAAAGPPLDLEALAERVYRTLERRQLRERERRGLY